MFNYNELRSVHIEITSRCQASCPMCTRNYHGGLSNPNIKNNDWTIEDYKLIFPPNLLMQLTSICLCGNFGDPMINDDLIEMMKYSTEQNPLIEIQIHTNGGARSTKWWVDLAQSLPLNHSVHFSIDGLEDTHHIYRIGTTYDKVIKNARAFINAGGKAKWIFLRFKHNEHQIEEVRRRAIEFNFESFILKDTTRFVGSDKFGVYNKAGDTSYYLEPASNTKIKFIDQDVIKNYKKILDNFEINCIVKKSKQVYIDAHKHVYPCCYLGATSYVHYVETDLLKPIRDDVRQQMKDLIAELGTLENINATKRNLKEILDSTVWLTIWEKYWTINKLIVCARTCGKIKNSENFSKPIDQFVNIERL